MGSDRDTEHTSTAGGASPTIDAERMFPRLELPPVPSFGRPPEQDADEVVPLRDEPVWFAPYAPKVDPELQYRAMVERVAALSDAEATATPPSAPLTAPQPPQPQPEPQPEPQHGPELHASPVPATVEHMPELATELPATIHKTSAVAVGIMLVTAALLFWASRMAFSPALLALAGLLVAQLASATAASERAGIRPLLLGGVSIVLALLAAKGGLHGFSEMAFVAGLFVLVAVLPTLLLLGAMQFVLRRRGVAGSPVDLALRAGWKLRFGALLAVLLAGVQAHRTFSAVPDAIVTFGIVALIAVTVLPVLRGRTAT